MLSLRESKAEEIINRLPSIARRPVHQRDIERALGRAMIGRQLFQVIHAARNVVEGNLGRIDQPEKGLDGIRALGIAQRSRSFAHPDDGFIRKPDQDCRRHNPATASGCAAGNRPRVLEFQIASDELNFHKPKSTPQKCFLGKKLKKVRKSQSAATNPQPYSKATVIASG
jgi:hypothetical protein